MVLSAWIAITDSTPEMGCVQVIPGSHRKVLPHVPLGRDDELPSNFVNAADPTAYSASEAVAVPMRAGQAMLFNERTLHHSRPNTTSRRRIGLAVRVIPPLVRVFRYLVSILHI